MEGEQAQRSRVLPASLEKRTPGCRLLSAESWVTIGEAASDSFLGLCPGCSQTDKLWLGCVTLKDPCQRVLSRSPNLMIEFLSSVAVGHG